jgi:hypothetical protein
VATVEVYAASYHAHLPLSVLLDMSRLLEVVALSHKTVLSMTMQQLHGKMRWPILYNNRFTRMLGLGTLH